MRVPFILMPFAPSLVCCEWRGVLGKEKTTPESSPATTSNPLLRNRAPGEMLENRRCGSFVLFTPNSHHV